jgi:hypothetical protein
VLSAFSNVARLPEVPGNANAPDGALLCFDGSNFGVKPAQSNVFINPCCMNHKARKGLFIRPWIGMSRAHVRSAMDARAGVSALKSQAANDAKNIESLILATLDNLRATLPEIDDYEFDFNTGQFRDRSSGKILSGDDFDLGANRTAGARTALAGSRTLKRAAFINSLLRAPSESRPQLLEYVLRLNDPQLGCLCGIFPGRDAPNNETVSKRLQMAKSRRARPRHRRDTCP